MSEPQMSDWQVSYQRQIAEAGTVTVDQAIDGLLLMARIMRGEHAEGSEPEGNNIEATETRPP